MKNKHRGFVAADRKIRFLLKQLFNVYPGFVDILNLYRAEFVCHALVCVLPLGDAAVLFVVFALLLCLFHQGGDILRRIAQGGGVCAVVRFLLSGFADLCGGFFRCFFRCLSLVRFFAFAFKGDRRVRKIQLCAFYCNRRKNLRRLTAELPKQERADADAQHTQNGFYQSRLFLFHNFLHGHSVWLTPLPISL